MKRALLFCGLLLTASIAAGMAGGASVGIAVFAALLLLKCDVTVKFKP